MKMFLLVFLLMFLAAAVGYAIFNSQQFVFAEFSPEEMYQQIIAERDFAIGEAKKRGDYRCCIEPPCTMCYMEANQWNNYMPGTCVCDDLIAQGKEACPQCQRGLGIDGGAACSSK